MIWEIWEIIEYNGKTYYDPPAGGDIYPYAYKIVDNTLVVSNNTNEIKLTLVLLKDGSILVLDSDKMSEWDEYYHIPVGTVFTVDDVQ